MATVRSFRALRPDPENAAAVSAVPYDVVSTAEARALAAGNPLSFLHVSRPEIDLEEGADPHADAVYATRRREFREAAARGAARRPSGRRRSTSTAFGWATTSRPGVAGCASIDEYDRDVVRKHERTRKDKEDDRTRHMVRLRAQTGPVFLTYRDRPEIDGIVEEARREAPLFDFTASDGVSHTVWRLSPEATVRLEAAFRAAPLLYIADGHHRAASASRARQELAGRQSRATRARSPTTSS